MQEPLPRTQAARRAETRARLLAAARALFAEKGYAATGTPELVAAAGVTRGALYHHFADKADLFLAVVEAEHAALAAAIDAAADTEPADPVAALLAGGEAFLAAMQDEGRRRILLRDAPSVLPGALLDEIDARHGLRTLVEGLQAAMTAGVLRPLPVLPLAQLLNAMFDRAALAGPENLDDYRVALAALIDGLRR